MALIIISAIGFRLLPLDLAIQAKLVAEAMIILHEANRGLTPSVLFHIIPVLTHAHIGHYAGLVHLGREVMGTQRMPVYATSKMADFLRNNAPWSQLVDLNNIELQSLPPTAPTALGANLCVTPYLVPHRDELADTIAVVVRGATQQLFYCPDIDAWDEWDYDVHDFVSEMDVAVLDATFFSAEEVAGRGLSGVPHPLATDTAERLAGVDCDVYLTHLNHTNPLLAPGPERDWLASHSIRVGGFGQRWAL
ncbi:MAG: Coenzyme PQQ synthesis protein B [Anaerolineales bacterium]|nr:Coenzyme PQQ synthesis protein B [Anaerolineales bacterium]